MPKRFSVSSVFLYLLFAAGTAAAQNAPLDLDAYQAYEGFVDTWWDEENGRMLVRVEEFDTPFIYQTSLPRGVGSNDIGLDRGQLGTTKIVRFLRSGPKILLVEDNLQFRGGSENAEERRAIDESFARSVIWGFVDIDDDDDSTIVDATAFFVRDAHGVGARLAMMGEGSFNVDDSRSAIFLPRTKAFPDNTEIEALVTLVGTPTGKHLPTVMPDRNAVTVHVHHSFIRLPDDNYEPLPYMNHAVASSGCAMTSAVSWTMRRRSATHWSEISGAGIACKKSIRRPRSARLSNRLSTILILVRRNR